MEKASEDFFKSRYGDISKFREPSKKVPAGKRLIAEHFKCVAERLMSEWCNGMTIYPYSFYQGRTIDVLKAYATGRQDNSKIKGYLLQKNTDRSKKGKFMTRMNVSWECYDKLSQLLDIMKDRNLSQEYQPEFFAIDETSINTVEADKQVLKFYIDSRTKEFLNKSFFKPNLEVDPEQLGLLTDQDVDHYFETGGYNTQWQIAAQACLRATYRASNYMEQQDLCFENHIINPEGLSGMKIYKDKTTGIPMLKTLDIRKCIIPYFEGRVSTDKITRSGVIETMTMADVYRANPKITKKDMMDIARNFGSINPGLTDVLNNSGLEYNYHNPYLSTKSDNYSDDPILSAKVYVLDFQFLGEDIHTYIKHEERDFFKEVEYDRNINRKSEKSGEKRVEKNIIKKYHAKWVIGTDYFIEYGQCEDTDYFGEDGRVVPRIDFYYSRHGNKSLIERCVAIVDDIWMRLIKERNLWATLPAAPSMVISKALLENVFLQGKKAASPEEIMSMFIEKGIFVFDDRDPSGKPKIQAGNGQKPFEIANLAPLIGMMSAATQDMMNKVGELKDVLGLTGGIDGDKSPYQGLGETQMAFEASNSSLRPTFNAYNYLFKDVMTGLVCMWQTYAKKNKGKKLAHSIIGEQNLKMIELSKEFINAKFQVGIRIAPSSQEKQALLLDLKDLVKASITGGSGIEYSQYLYLYEKVLSGQIKEAMFHLSRIMKRQKIEAQEFELQKIRENVKAQQESSDHNLQNNMRLKEIEGQQKISNTILDNLMKTIKDLQIKSVERGGESGGVDKQRADQLISENTIAASDVIQNAFSGGEGQQMTEEEAMMMQQQQGALEPNDISI